MSNSILILEDSPSCQKIACDSLKKVASISSAFSIGEAREYLLAHSVSLVLIDLNLPDGNGLDFYAEMQTSLNHANTPVLFISGNDDISKKLAAFSCGAEDYIVKPYAPMELRARVERIFRSFRISDNFTDQKSGLDLDFAKYKATYDWQGQQQDLDLTPQEFKILYMFIKNPQQVFSRQQVLDHVWGVGVFLTPRTVDTHISTLRKKIVNLPIKIQSVRGEGYRLEFDSKRKAS